MPNESVIVFCAYLKAAPWMRPDRRCVEVWDLALVHVLREDVVGDAVADNHELAGGHGGHDQVAEGEGLRRWREKKKWFCSQCNRDITKMKKTNWRSLNTSS